jgi:hypothetical protein
MLILAVVMAFFLLMEYFNTRKTPHLLWSFALIFTFIAFHQVANTGSYTWLFESWGTGFMIIIPGLIASGVLLSTFESKPLIGQLYLLLIAIVAVITTISGLEYIAPTLEIDDVVRYSLVAVPGLISVGIMLGVPLYTTLISKETTSKALLMVGAAAILIIYIVVSIFAYTTEDTLIARYVMMFWVWGLFPYIFILTITLLVLGIHYEPKWTFTIPGVEVEDEARIEQLTFQKNKALIISAAVIAGGIMVLLGGALASLIKGTAETIPPFPPPPGFTGFTGSEELLMAISIGGLIIGGLLGALIGFAILIGWEPSIRGKDITNYLRICVGVITLVFAIIIVAVPSSPAGVFETAEAAMWDILSLILLYVGAILILAGGVLSEFVIKE